MKLKFLSRCHLQFWKISNSVNFILFFRSSCHTNGFLLRASFGYFLSLKIRQWSKGMSCFLLGTNMFLIYTIITRASSDQSSYGPAALGNGFQLSGDKTQREEQQSHKFALNYFLVLHWNFPPQWLQNYDYLVRNEAVCSSEMKIANEGRSLNLGRKKLFHLVNRKKIKTYIHQ